jgi:aldose 1-epimerase
MELLFNGQLVSVLDSYTSEKELLDTLNNSFKGSNLFPFPNRIDSGKFKFNGKEHKLPINFPQENNAIHGLIYNKKFKIICESVSNESASLELGYSSLGELEGYPYKFDLRVTYTFAENGTEIRTSYKNSDEKHLPAGNGWHPYFALVDNVDELHFSFPSSNLYEVNNRMLPTGVTSDYIEFNEPAKINTANFDTCFFLTKEEGIAKTKLINKSKNSGLTIWQETGKNKFNFLQVYTPPHRKSIAIEPMTCLPNAFNNKNGYSILSPGEELSVSWGIAKN